MSTDDHTQCGDEHLMLRNDTVAISELPLSAGETLVGARLHYRTMGEPVRDRGGQIVNAALLLHGTTGSSEQYLQPAYRQELFAAGKPLDVQRWFIVMPDAIGHGQSSKPSDGQYGRFPTYGYRDMVDAQQLVCTHLGIHHLRLVLGASMGGMQTWMWAGLYPDHMDALVAIASEPAPIRGRNLLWRRMITRAIRADSSRQPDQRPATSRGFWTTWPLFSLMTSTPHRLAHIGDAAQALAQLDEWADAALDPWDMLYALEASTDYDPRPLLGRIRAPLLMINFADDEVNPPELGHIDDALRQARTVRAVMLPPGPASYGHQTLAHPEMYVDHLTAFLAELPDI